MINQKLATSNLNLRAPNFGQKGEIGKIAATTETTDGAEELMDPKSAVFRPLWRYLCVFLVPGVERSSGAATPSRSAELKEFLSSPLFGDEIIDKMEKMRRVT